MIKAIFASLSIMTMASLTIAQTTRDLPKDETSDYKKGIELIVGDWALQTVADEGKRDTKAQANESATKNTPQQSSGSATGTSAPESNSSTQTANSSVDNARNSMQVMEFDRQMRYRMKNKDQVTDEGSFRINEQHAILYLDSDAVRTPTEFNFSVSGDKLVLTGRSGDADKRYSYTYTRTKHGVSTTR